jgi:hypothetical protein
MLKWKAVYCDGSELPQFNGDGSENKYLDIKRDVLSQFVMLDDNRPVVVLHLDGNKRLICRKRVRMNVDGSTRDFIWIVGWQETIFGEVGKISDGSKYTLEARNMGIVCVVFQDGHIEVVEKLKEGHPWFYPVELIEEEKI